MLLLITTAFKSKNVHGSSTCEYCSSPRCPSEVFQGLSFVPDPLLGKVLNPEKDRPSAGNFVSNDSFLALYSRVGIHRNTG